LAAADREVERIGADLEARSWKHRLDDRGHTVEDDSRILALRDFLAEPEHAGWQVSQVAINVVLFVDQFNVPMLSGFPRWPSPPPPAPMPVKAPTPAEAERERNAEHLRRLGLGYIVDNPETLAAVRSLLLGAK
jgi:hypothetical protein